MESVWEVRKVGEFWSGFLGGEIVYERICWSICFLFAYRGFCFVVFANWKCFSTESIFF